MSKVNEMKSLLAGLSSGGGLESSMLAGDRDLPPDIRDLAPNDEDSDEEDEDGEDFEQQKPVAIKKPITEQTSTTTSIPDELDDDGKLSGYLSDLKNLETEKASMQSQLVEAMEQQKN